MRSEFQRDNDRLIFSGAFRRLQGKTQVVSPSEADFFRTRLTHTIEVGQISRRLAELLNEQALAAVDSGDTQLAAFCGDRGCIDPDICAAASSLHDLGHPPFGHAGEQALVRAVDRLARQWEIGGSLPERAQLTGSFNGNAQSLRMAVCSLTHKPGIDGLELTRAVLDGTIKYPWSHAEHPENKGWSVYPTEAEAFEWIREGVPDECAGERSLEAELVDFADDIAYAVHDLEDWYRAGLFPLDQLTQAGSQALARLKDVVAARWDEGDALELVEHVFLAPDGGFGAFRSVEFDGVGATVDPHGVAGREAMRQTRSALYDECFSTTGIELHPHAAAGWPKRFALRLRVDPEVRRKNRLLRELLWIYVVDSHVLATQQNGQRGVVHDLFEIYADAADPNVDGASSMIFPPDVRREIDASEERSVERLRLVTDFVAGMTDDYAIRLHGRLCGGGSPYPEFI